MKSLILLIYFVICVDLKELDLGLVIAALDATVLKKMENPAEGGGEDLLEGIVLYNRSFVQLIRLMKAKEDASIKKIVLSIYEQGGPKILQYNIDESLIKERFSWGDKDFEHLSDRLIETNVLWQEFDKTFWRNHDWFNSD